MTITIPTGDLVGLLNDVVPFAFPDDDLPHVNVVRISWDGDMLHAEATDTLHAARSTWHPDDDPHNSDQPQGAMFAVHGGADQPWAILAGYDDAKEVVKDYKLPTKEAGTPLTLDYRDGNLTIRRSRDTGHTAKTIVLEGRAVDFPRVGDWLDEQVLPVPVGEVAYSGAVVARVGLVRQRGLMRMTFGRLRTHVTIGTRFVASLAPDRSGDRQPAPTFDLRTASGVLIGAGTGEG